MKKIFLLFFLFANVYSFSQELSSSPDFPKETDAGVVITLDASKGNQALVGYNPADVYVHIGCITTLSTSAADWKYVKFTWGTTDPNAKAVSLGSNKWTYTLTGTDMRAFFGITNSAEHIKKISVLFRSGNGNIVQRNADGSDMYVPVYDANLYTKIVNPFRQPTYVPLPETITKNVGDAVSIEAKASTASGTTMTLFFNGVQVNSLSGNDITANPTIIASGTQRIIAQAINGSTTVRDTFDFYVAPSSTISALPTGAVDGLNYDPNGTDVTLVLYAPNKTNIVVIGDFNNWTQTTSYQMNKTPDGLRYWLKITGLTPGTEYAYQYVIDGSLKVADYNSEKILDPNNDPYISTTTYPGLKPYPTGLTTGIVSVLQTNKPAYNWQVNNFTKPDKRNLVIYELLVRDFVAAGNFQTVKDSIAYLKKLGITAIEVMPFNEFEGNNSWGYNPSFYFAPDKAYGTETAVKQFIDECHKQGIAVIMDMVMNHSCGTAPTVQMYFNSATGKPAANSPWYNVDAPHPFNVCYDFNHEAPATKDLVARVVRHWLTKYKIDGFRWDLSKGFTQFNSGTNAALMANYDASRVAIWERIYDTMQQVSSGSYCILEHFADNSEELVLSNYGMLLWGNENYNANQASMGYSTNGDWNFHYGIYTDRGWSQPNLVTYMESHDEERLNYKNENYGNQNGNGTYNIQSLNTALKRQELVAAFWAMTPAPKLMWQFGELGYDYSINACQNGTLSNNCRTDPKAIRWDYLNNANRLALHDVYSKLLTLRKVPNYLKAFTSNNITYDLANSFKSMVVVSDSLNIVVIGNFDVNFVPGSVTFPKSGTWYEFFSGNTINVARAGNVTSNSFGLVAGEYRVYLDRDPSALINALPLTLLNFTGKRTPTQIALQWNTAQEINLKNFVIERSLNAIDFTEIGTVNAGQNNYQFNDIDAVVLKATHKVFYRLKMIDKDGQFSYSKIVAIDGINATISLSLYPNPVATNMLYAKANGTLPNETEITITDISGRVLKSLKANTVSLSDGTIPLNISSLANGVYLIKISGNNLSEIKRFVVQR